VIVNRKAVQRHMHEMGIAGVAPGPHLSTPTPHHPLYPDLLRHVTSASPNHVWGIDITSIKGVLFLPGARLGQGARHDRLLEDWWLLGRMPIARHDTCILDSVTGPCIKPVGSPEPEVA